MGKPNYRWAYFTARHFFFINIRGSEVEKSPCQGETNKQQISHHPTTKYNLVQISFGSGWCSDSSRLLPSRFVVSYDRHLWRPTHTHTQTPAWTVMGRAGGTDTRPPITPPHIWRTVSAFPYHVRCIRIPTWAPGESDWCWSHDRSGGFFRTYWQISPPIRVLCPFESGINTRSNLTW